jgi:hypothetical protein
MGNSKGFVKLEYVGNNSRIDKILKNGKRHYKLEDVVRQRYLQTIGIYSAAEGQVVTTKFYLTNVKDEESYWKFGHKKNVNAVINNEESTITLKAQNKARVFNIVLC